VSMLTPPGLKGKQYRITGSAYPRLSRPHRRRRRVFALIGAVVAIGVIGWGTVQLISVFGGRTRASAATTNCRAKAHPAGANASAAANPSQAALPQPGKITVNVYNSTTRTGLAAQTAAAFKQRGFVIGKIGNAPAPLEGKVPGAAEIIGGPSSAQVETVVGTQVPGAQSTTDTRQDASVDLVLGNTFNALATPAQAAQALTAAQNPKPTATASAHC
jgi:hypothetical protein